MYVYMFYKNIEIDWQMAERPTVRPSNFWQHLTITYLDLLLAPVRVLHEKVEVLLRESWVQLAGPVSHPVYADGLYPLEYLCVCLHTSLRTETPSGWQ